MLKENLALVHEMKPLVHSLTNYVTVNDVANMILASGASPVMADEMDDACQIAAFSSATYLNIGTLNERTMATMEAVARISKERGIPVVLDPVGAGATTIRTNFARFLLEQNLVDVVRGNLSEIKVLVQNSGGAIGDDADVSGFIREENLNDIAAFLGRFAKKFNVIAVATGEIDVIAGKNRYFAVRNGIAYMSRITGTGCQLTGLIGAYCGACALAKAQGLEADLLEAVATAVTLMGVAGEIGYEHLADYEGNSTLRNRIIDAVDRMTAERLTERGKIEELQL